jgi:protein-L-isoaspartate(D-aspartate) O-methyltransferase
MTARDALLRILRAEGIRDERVLAALAAVPREEFVPADQKARAWDNRALSIGLGQTISQPFMVAIMTELLALEPSHRVLEIGTGSGYQAAVLARLAAVVYSVDRVAELSERAHHTFSRLGIANVRLLVADGTAGWRDEAPFDRIIVTAGAPHVPRALREQLADGGRLVIPVGGRALQTLVVVRREGDAFVEEPGIGCVFVPLVGEDGWQLTQGERQ